MYLNYRDGFHWDKHANVAVPREKAARTGRVRRHGSWAGRSRLRCGML